MVAKLYCILTMTFCCLKNYIVSQQNYFACLQSFIVNKQNYIVSLQNYFAWLQNFIVNKQNVIAFLQCSIVDLQRSVCKLQYSFVCQQIFVLNLIRCPCLHGRPLIDCGEALIDRLLFIGRSKSKEDLE